MTSHACRAFSQDIDAEASDGLVHIMGPHSSEVITAEGAIEAASRLVRAAEAAIDQRARGGANARHGSGPTDEARESVRSLANARINLRAVAASQQAIARSVQLLERPVYPFTTGDQTQTTP